MRKYFHLHFALLILSVFTFSPSIAQVEVILKPGPLEGKDAYVNSYYERLDSTQSIIAAAWTYDGTEGIGRSFIQFNLPQLPDSISDFQAFLNLYYDPTSHHVGHGGDNVCKLERIIEHWTEKGVSWHVQPAVNSDNAVFLPASITSNQDYPNIDVTQLVLDMYAHPDSSFGFRLSLVDETIYRSMILASSDHSNPDLWPSLVIRYNTPCDAPIASFKYINYNNAVHFIADSVDNGEYWWSFGNGYFSDLKSPSFIYTQPGTYNVCLSISNNCGTDTYCDTIVVCEETIYGTFTSRTEGNFAYFVSNVLSDKVDLLWDFGDGFITDIDNPAHYYGQPGKYLVCMIAKNYCNQVIFSDSLYILPIQPQVKNSDVIQLYPNPTEGVISISHGGIPAEFKSIRVINFDGTIVLNEGHYRLIKKENGYFCDFTGLESGIYTIHVVTDIGVFTQKAVIIATK
ncbi:MAG: DNRLRE domain-containing protein [Chloroflexota bacterium]|nr:DNRLRE domain-containing protein [Lentimicrobium sp.]